jgi:hypothetical protein
LIPMASIATQRLFSSKIAANRNRWLLETIGFGSGRRRPFMWAIMYREMSFKEVPVKHDNITDIATYCRAFLARRRGSG